MSRRPDPSKAAANQNTIKQLLKLEGNKVCADCKRNKHPRWASWNLGIFICIRCSGIHRGMGTHISRVKSVDLDAWTDEQLASVLKWGNARANKYWEAKLAPGHVPSDAKIENFIRTKYEAKRWVMDGPIPDPSTLDTGEDDDVPLNVVQEKAKLDRAASQRASSASSHVQPVRRPQPNVDLFGDDAITPPVRPSTTDIPSRPPPPPQPTAPNPPAKQHKPGDSLLGLDFFGGPPSSAPARPSSVTSTQSRPDLKQSILSLYASVPKPQSPPAVENKPAANPPAQKDAFGGLADAFGGLNFASSSTTSPAPARPSSGFGDFGGFSNPVTAKSTPAAAQLTSPLGGGNFFNPAPKPPTAPKAPAQTQPTRAPSNGLDFSFASAPAPVPAPALSKPTSPPSKDLFDDDFAGFTSPTPPVAPPPTRTSPPPPQPSASISSVFNLSNPIPPSQPAAPKPAISSQPSTAASALFDPWSSESNAWSTPESNPAPQPASTASRARAPSLGKPPAHITPNDIGGGWGSPLSSAHSGVQAAPSMPTNHPTVTADEDFGGWTSAATPVAPTTTTSGGGAQQPKPNTGFGGGSDDLFSNVWE